MQSTTAPASVVERRQPPGRQAGAEPLPGYRLLDLLGQGGFGEVWRCEAPGGLLKAIKFVEDCFQDLRDSSSAAAKEHDALQRVKAVRHPFILSIDRVEVVQGVLLTVMELAERSLQSLFDECQNRGLPGIPRDDLLGYLAEASEALDVMGLHHDLQHLDVKPQNLFLIGGHVKVADFGLVHRMEERDMTVTPRCSGGFTPLYAAPEVWQDRVSRHSDQYSLAVVYQHLLTGVPPFNGQNARHLMLQHLTTPPDLSALPNQDRAAVARALAKDPEQRFSSCLHFVKALLDGYAADASEGGAAPASAEQEPPNKPTRLVRRLPRDLARAPAAVPREADNRTSLTQQPAETPAPAPTTSPAAAGAAPEPSCALATVLPLSSLLGRPAAAELLVPPVSQIVAELAPEAAGLGAAGGDPSLHYTVRSDGTWEYRCSVRLFPGALRLKVEAFCDVWGGRMTHQADTSFCFYLPLGKKRSWWGLNLAKQPRLEVGIAGTAPPGPINPVSEVWVRLRLAGAEPGSAPQVLALAGPQILESIRAHLQARPDQRGHQRCPCAHPLVVYPLLDDLEVGEPLQGVGNDVSPGGVGFLVPRPPRAYRCFLSWPLLPRLAPFAVQVQIVRVQQRGPDSFHVGVCFHGQGGG
jgi:hypothetical protein